MNHDKIISLEKNIHDITNKLDDINNKLDTLLIMCNNDIKPNCEKMNEHITFVNDVYEKVRLPLSYLCNKFNYILSRNDELPQIQDV